jgi:hypothetical protein
VTSYAVVSFWRTPLAEVSAVARRIEALGWREEDRGDPWTVLYAGGASEEELRRAMGDYWLSGDDIRALRGE